MTPQSVPPIASPTPQYYSRAETVQTLKQLGRDLQSGDLAQAQADYSALRQYAPAAIRNGNTLHAFQALGSALQSGSASDAHQAFKTLVEDLYKRAHAQPVTSDALTSQDDSSGSATATTGLDVTA